MNFFKTPAILLATVLLSVPSLAAGQPEIKIDLPLDYQVVQRQTRREGIVTVSGRVPVDAEKVEVWREKN